MELSVSAKPCFTFRGSILAAPPGSRGHDDANARTRTSCTYASAVSANDLFPPEAACHTPTRLYHSGFFKTGWAQRPDRQTFGSGKIFSYIFFGQNSNNVNNKKWFNSDSGLSRHHKTFTSTPLICPCIYTSNYRSIHPSNKQVPIMDVFIVLHSAAFAAFTNDWAVNSFIENTRQKLAFFVCFLFCAFCCFVFFPLTRCT